MVRNVHPTSYPEIGIQYLEYQLLSVNEYLHDQNLAPAAFAFSAA